MVVQNKQRILIVGGGFGGIKAALDLCKNSRFEITLLSDSPNFRYNPALYHTATGGIRAESNIPLFTIFRDKAVTLARGRAIKLDRASKTVYDDKNKAYSYDILILALGMVTNYFGIHGLAEYSYGIKSIKEAERFKRHIHQQLTNEHKPDLNYIIVGGGPTGIELAGALPEYLHRIAQAHSIKHKAIRIELVEANRHLVPRLPKSTGKAIERQLRRLGVTLILGKKVEGETASALMIDGKPLPSHTVIWTAGMANAPFYTENNFQLNEHGKVAVDQYLQTESGIFVLGDNNSTPYSGMAQTAIYDGHFVAQNLIRQSEQKKPKAYRPKKPVYVMPAGPKWAAVLWGRWQFHGRIGWLLRSLADLWALHDVEPWWQAAEQWMTEFGTEEQCPTCATWQDS